MIHWQRIGCASLLIVTMDVAGCAKQSAPTATTAPAAPQAAPAAAQPPTVAPDGESVATKVTVPADETAVDALRSEQTPGTAAAPQPAVGFYSVAAYNENQNPTADLAATIQRATAENKRILIQVGGEWCGWCHRISDYMETNEKVRQLVDDHFIVMKVTYPGAHVESFLEQYPRVEAYPHLFVLEPDGKFLHSQGTAELEFEKSYNEEVFCKFLSDWVL
jgi:hypothetical protein